MTIEAPFIGLSRDLVVSPGSTAVQLDATLRLATTAISFKGIRVKSEHPISVHVLDIASTYDGGFLVLPNDLLGSQYVAVTSAGVKSQLVISSAIDRNDVTVTIRGNNNVTHRGIVYRNGDAITETLDTFQTWQIESDGDLTGTTITAKGRIAVISSNLCSYIPETSTTCDFTVEQLLPSNAWGRTFVVPFVSLCLNKLRVMLRDDATQVRVVYDNQIWTATLNSSNHIDRDFLPTPSTPQYAVVEADKPVSVNLFTGSIMNLQGHCAPSMTSIPATLQYLDSYQIHVPFPNITFLHLSLIVPSGKQNTISIKFINNNPVSVLPSTYGEIVQTDHGQYVVIHVNATVPAAGGLMVTSSEHASFGAILYAATGNGSLSTPLGLAVELLQGIVYYV